MELTKEQVEFLNKVCSCVKGFVGRGWSLNRYDKVDVNGNVDMRDMNLTEIPIKFGKVDYNFDCSENNLTTLKNLPNYIGGVLNCSFNNLTNLDTYHLRFGHGGYWIPPGGVFQCYGNPLTEYFKNIKSKDFKHWDKLDWGSIIEEYPFLIKRAKKYSSKNTLKRYLDEFPQTKLYLDI